MKFNRAAGVLLHPTSLPGRFGIGDLGKEAYEFADFLKDSGMTLWQILPIGSPGNGELPYQSYSVFGCNHYLISPEKLVEKEYLISEDLSDIPDFSETQIDFGKTLEFKDKLFRKAFQNFLVKKECTVSDSYNDFCDVNKWWLNDYAFFMALKETFGGKPWYGWPNELVHREQNAMHEWGTKLCGEIAYHKFLQFEFFQEWNALKNYCNINEIRIIGDIPIFVSHDSADVWSNPELFHLDGNGNATVVAGVPPDYFSATGQRWGNPLYRWDIMEKDGYNWWGLRFKLLLKLVDIIRIDHFRGFVAYWEIPANEDTAVNGNWVKGPGDKFFSALCTKIVDPPIIAEDLGLITPGVRALRNNFNFPGMKVLQFAFYDGANEYLPHNYEKNCVVYTGTHDNNTTLGWFNFKESDSTQNSESEMKARKFCLEYLNSDGKEIHWDLIRLAFSSVADSAIVPMQDILGLGSDARMNIPGTAHDNWRWRYNKKLITKQISERLLKYAKVFERIKILED